MFRLFKKKKLTTKSERCSSQTQHIWNVHYISEDKKTEILIVNGKIRKLIVDGWNMLGYGF